MITPTGASPDINATAHRSARIAPVGLDPEPTQEGTRTMETTVTKPGCVTDGCAGGVHAQDRCGRCYRKAARSGEITTSTSAPRQSVPPPWAPAWTESALCAEVDPELWFPEKGESAKTAKRVCMACPVRNLCLDLALANGERHGVWGGLSERERRVLLGRTREREGGRAA